MVIFSYIEYLKYSRIIKEEYSLNEEVAEYKYDNKKINHIHDKTFRKILDYKKEFTIFINKIFNLEEKLEEKDIEKYNRKFVSVDYTNQESDVIYKLKNKEIFILVEHQTKIDKKMPIRILKYELEIIRSRMDENNRLEFPIIIPIVLYTGKQRWNAKINYPSYNSELARYRGLKKVEYNLVDINDYTIEDLYKENSILTKIMILEKSNKYIEIINNVDKIVNKVYDSKLYTQTQKEMLLNILNNTMINIVGNKKMKEYKIKLEGGENMLALYEMIENERNEIYSTGIKEGKVKGKIEGIKAIAKKMLRMKFDKDTIMKATGIKEEELEKMKK
jgi:predicted transposase/invertase (TIGR01784 family)